MRMHRQSVREDDRDQVSQLWDDERTGKPILLPVRFRYSFGRASIPKSGRIAAGSDGLQRQAGRAGPASGISASTIATARVSPHLGPSRFPAVNVIDGAWIPAAAAVSEPTWVRPDAAGLGPTGVHVSAGAATPASLALDNPRIDPWVHHSLCDDGRTG